VATDDTNTASVPGRYASALFELAKDQKQVPTVEADLVRFEAMLTGSADLQRLVRSPAFSGEEQSKAIAAILAKANIGGLAGNFLKLLAKNRRLFAVSDMTKSFRAFAAKDRGEVTAEVTSAQPLTDAQMAALTDQLKVTVGKAVSLHTKVDPSLLGGLIVKIGSRMIDSSLRTKLSMLKVAMKGTG
jgi:F-type H+-transporting ATPase subunit delta